MPTLGIVHTSFALVEPLMALAKESESVDSCFQSCPDALSST